MHLQTIAAKAPDMNLFHTLGVVDTVALLLIPLLALVLIAAYGGRYSARFQKTDARYTVVSTWSSRAIRAVVLVGPWYALAVFLFNNWYWSTSF